MTLANNALFAASVVLFLTGLVHSVAGELLIFRRLPKDAGFPPLVGHPQLGRWTVHGTWHLATALALIPAWLLLQLSHDTSRSDDAQRVVTTSAWALLAGAALFLAFTRGRHPGWAALLAAAVLCFVA